LISILALLIGYSIWGDLFRAVVAQYVALVAYYITWLVFLFRAAGYARGRLNRIFVEVAVAGVMTLAVCHALAVALPALTAFLIGVGLATAGSLLVGVRGWAKLRNCLGSTNARRDKLIA